MAQKTIPDENDVIYDTYGIDLVGYLKAFIEKILGTDGSGGGAFQNFFDTLSFLWNIYSVIAVLLSLLFLAGFIYARIRLAQLYEIQDQQLRETEVAWAHAYGNGAQENNRWKDIQHHIASDNPGDWRLGIIEADILLEEALDDAGYVGASVGDRLKTVNSGMVHSLQDAWDAHLVRNQIAHAGSEFMLTKRMANEAVIKYERFLRELGAL